MRSIRHFPLKMSILLVFLLLNLSTLARVASASAKIDIAAQTQGVNSHPYNPNAALLQKMVHDGRLAPDVHVLDSLPPTTIIQFPLVPSGIKKAFPKATGLVTMIRGDRDNALSDTVIVDVQNMPANITFTIFFIELANKPFGNVEYVADLTTRGDGSGETIFQNIALVAFAMDARNPGTSQDNVEGATSGTNLEHLGMWFASLADAQKVLNDGTLTGTIFDGGNPPLHAGPQAMTDGQTDPVF